MTTTITRRGREILLQHDGPAVHLTPERARIVAWWVRHAWAYPAPQLVWSCERSAGYRLVLVLGNGLAVLANLGPYGDAYAGWEMTECGDVAREIEQLAGEADAVKSRRKAA